ncbi:rNA polymerase sigma-70 factor ECF subfamily [Firmicutes bacterium CAG:449]|nr:rNA polymerase sigma-70 factor ECF subfamily [Firmicutes bacterium CAG:449]
MEEINLLIKEFKNKNHSNFEKFYNLTSKQVYFTSLNILKNHALAEEITQDVYVKFLSEISSFKEYYNVFSYLTTISRNLSINVYNKNKKIINDEEIINFAKYDDSTIDDLNAQEILSLIEETSSREIVVYHVIFEYTFLQISKIMKVPLGTILWKYNKTMKYLKERIKL